MKFDYSKLIGKIIEHYGSRKAFAIEVDMCYSTLVSKLNGESYFNQAEMEKIKTLLDLENYDYFFIRKVRVNKTCA